MTIPPRAKPPIVLMIEDEAILRASMARGLRAQGEMDVVEAGTLGEGLSLIDGGGVQAVICDIDLPDRSGLEIIGELARRSLNIPVLFVTAYLKAYRPQIPRHARVDVMEKPVPLADLRARVRTMVGSQVSAAASPFTLADYVQIACLGRRSVLIDVESEENTGQIFIVGGDLWHAQDDKGGGANAFKRLCFLKGSVSCAALEGDPPPRNVSDSYEALMLDAAREQDERNRDSETFLEPPEKYTPGPPKDLWVPAPPESDAKAEEEVFMIEWDRGVAALLRKDYATASDAFLAAKKIHPEDPRLIANLKRLKDMGHLPTETG